MGWDKILCYFLDAEENQKIKMSGVELTRQRDYCLFTHYTLIVY